MKPVASQGIRPFGDRGYLLDVASVSQAMALGAALTEHRLPGQLDIVPGARSVLIRLRELLPVEQVAQHCALLEGIPAPTTNAEPLLLDIRYDGPDLAEVAELTGLSVTEVIAEHTGQLWTVAFAGFCPGFGYLTCQRPTLHTPRRQAPRASVPAGAVGLAGEFSGIYPRSSPGGWQLIGSCDAVLFDADRAEPALLQPGQQVQFRQVRR